MSLHDLVMFARSYSPFYQRLYKALPKALPTSEDELRRMLPLIDSEAFWKANTLKNNQLLTGDMSSGIVFKSGGTTGSPKFSVFTKAEWKNFTRSFGRGLVAGGLRPAERVANIFYAGEFYASFIFIMKSFEEATTDSLHLPISGTASIESILRALVDFEATILAGTPTLIIQLAQTYRDNKCGWGELRLKRILFGGESLYADQRELLLSIFPGIEIMSIGYASVDAGLLGYADLTCGPDEHRTFGSETIYEIIDEETGAIIDEEGVVGKAYITYLDRRLMPVIRYPVGDRASWIEPKSAVDRKFRLLGRSEEAARVGPVSLFYEDVREILESTFRASPKMTVAGFQLIIKHFNRKDQLIIRLVPTDISIDAAVWKECVLKSRPMLREEAARGNIHGLEVELVKADGLEKNPRTGKMKRVIDLRKT